MLISALPFVLTTSEMHTISPDALQRGLLPPDLQVTKIYLSEHVEKLKQEFLSVKSMGGATVEEWLKGLELRGKESLSDSMRWEKWASTGGITQLSQDNVSNTHISSGKGLISTNDFSFQRQNHCQVQVMPATHSSFILSYTLVLPHLRACVAWLLLHKLISNIS